MKHPLLLTGLLLVVGCSGPLVVDPGAGITALTFEPGGTLLAGRRDGVIERRNRAGRTLASWELGKRSVEGIAIDPEGGFFAAANESESADAVPENCAITRVAASGESSKIATLPEACRTLAFAGEHVVVGGHGGLVAEIDRSGRTIRQRSGDGIVRALLVRDGSVFAAGQSSNGGFVLQVGGWTQRFGADYFDVAKDLELTDSNQVRVIGTMVPDPSVDRSSGFVAVIGTDGSGFHLREEPNVSAVHQMAGTRVVGHSPAMELEIGGCPLRSAGDSDAYLSTFNPDGSFDGAWIIGSDAADYGYAIAVAEDGRVAVGGIRGREARGWLAIFPRNAKKCGSLRLPTP